MANIIPIANLAAPELAVYTRLTEAQLRNRRAPDQGLFIAESAAVISTALDAGYRPVSLLMDARRLAGETAQRILTRCGDAPVYTADDELLHRLTGYPLTRGFLCAMRRPTLPEAETVISDARRLAVLENIVDAANVGAIFRSAAALGMDGLLLSPSCCDPFNRRTVRVSMGTVFQIPWTYAPDGSWPGVTLAQLRGRGFRTLAMALRPDAISMGDPRLRRYERLALLFGTEGTGLQPETIDACDETVMIPMSHGVDSLNVAASSAVAFWALRPE